MTVTIELNGQLSLQLPRQHALDLSSGTTVRQVAIRLGLNLDEIGLVTINGVQSDLQASLPPDCRLSLFPYLTGG